MIPYLICPTCLTHYQVVWGIMFPRCNVCNTKLTVPDEFRKGKKGARFVEEDETQETTENTSKKQKGKHKSTSIYGPVYETTKWKRHQEQYGQDDEEGEEE